MSSWGLGWGSGELNRYSLASRGPFTLVFRLSVKGEHGSVDTWSAGPQPQPGFPKVCRGVIRQVI